jgi:hypothetical protein
MAMDAVCWRKWWESVTDLARPFIDHVVDLVLVEGHAETMLSHATKLRA